MFLNLPPNHKAQARGCSRYLSPGPSVCYIQVNRNPLETTLGGGQGWPFSDGESQVAAESLPGQCLGGGVLEVGVHSPVAAFGLDPERDTCLFPDAALVPPILVFILLEEGRGNREQHYTPASWVDSKSPPGTC